MDNVLRATAVSRMSGSSRSDGAGHIKAGNAAAMRWTRDVSRSGTHGIVIAVRYLSCSSGPDRNGRGHSSVTRT